MVGIGVFDHLPNLSVELAEGDEDVVAAQVQHFVQNSLATCLPSFLKILSIDGLDGVGKSTLGRVLAAHVGARFVDLDDFLEQDRDCYFSAIQFRALKEAVAASESVVVAGCLVDAILAEIGEPADFRIYIVRTARMRGQPDMEFVDEWNLLCSGKSAAELIAVQEESARRWSGAPEPYGGGDSKVPELAKELIRYHCEFRPQGTADLIIRLARVN